MAHLRSRMFLVGPAALSVVLVGSWLWFGQQSEEAEKATPQQLLAAKPREHAENHAFGPLERAVRSVSQVIASKFAARMGDAKLAAEASADVTPELAQYAEYRSLPDDSSQALSELSTSLDLNKNETMKVKRILDAFVNAQRIVQKYSEPERAVKTLELKRQYRLTMHTALPDDKEKAFDDYFRKPRD